MRTGESCKSRWYVISVIAFIFIAFILVITAVYLFIKAWITPFGSPENLLYWSGFMVMYYLLGFLADSVEQYIPPSHCHVVNNNNDDKYSGIF